MKFIAFILLAFATFSVLAAQKTVTLEVENMSCAVCPITVKKSLEKLPGVREVRVSYEKKSAVVIYDDTKVSPAQMAAATRDAGYPSHVRTGEK